MQLPVEWGLYPGLSLSVQWQDTCHDGPSPQSLGIGSIKHPLARGSAAWNVPASSIPLLTSHVQDNQQVLDMPKRLFHAAHNVCFSVSPWEQLADQGVWYAATWDEPRQGSIILCQCIYR